MSSHPRTPVGWAREAREKQKMAGVGRWLGRQQSMGGLLSTLCLGVGARLSAPLPFPVPAQVLLQATGAGMYHLENGCIVGQAVSRSGTGEVV